MTAEAMKRVHLDLSRSLSELRAEIAMTATSVDVRRAIAEAMEPFVASVETLSETVRAMPLALGAITERVGAKMETLQVDLEEMLIALIPSSWENRLGSAPSSGTDKQAAAPDFWGS